MSNQWNKNAESISVLIHDLAQPLMVAKTYASGCLYRLSENNLDNEQLFSSLQKINDQISLIGNKIHEIKDLLIQQQQLIDIEAGN